MEKPILFKHNAKELNLKLKATVQKNLNLGFTADTFKTLAIKEGMGLLLFTEGEIPDKNVLFMQLLPEKTEESFRINKAGGYFYANTKSFFRKLFKGLGFPEDKQTTTIYDISEVEFDGEKFYQMVGREVGGDREDDEGDE